MTSLAPSKAALGGGKGTAPAERGGAETQVPPGMHRSFTPASILIVDDDPDVRDALESALRDEGFEVVMARDGVEALALLRHMSRPRLIVLDLTMPRMTGTEFHRHVVEELPQLRAVPVVVMSADLEGRSKARALGAAAFLRKPIRLTELLRTVDQQLRTAEQGA